MKLASRPDWFVRLRQAWTAWWNPRPSAESRVRELINLGQ
jgi:hypothetical protein